MPNEEDVMHAMKLEAWYTSDIEQTPRHTMTFYVLPTLPAPPKRQMLPIETDNTAPSTNNDFSMYHFLLSSTLITVHPQHFRSCRTTF